MDDMTVSLCNLLVRDGAMPAASLTYLLSAIAQDAIDAAERVFVRRFGLTIHELRVLRLIDDNPGTTFTWLTAATKIERSATSRILARLIKEGHVRREIDGADARRFRLRVTAKGQTLRAKADPLTQEMEAVMLSDLQEQDRANLTRILDQLSGWLASGFPDALARRYPEARLNPVARPHGRADKG